MPTDIVVLFSISVNKNIIPESILFLIFLFKLFKSEAIPSSTLLKNKSVPLISFIGLLTIKSTFILLSKMDWLCFSSAFFCSASFCNPSSSDFSFKYKST